MHLTGNCNSIIVSGLHGSSLLLDETNQINLNGKKIMNMNLMLVM